MKNDVNADVQRGTSHSTPVAGPADESPALEIRGVTKSYGRTRVLDGLDLTLQWGQVLSVLGPNGSGKTTLLKILATLTRFDAGSVRVAGMDADRDSARVRRATGVVMHEPMLYADLTGRENLRFFCRMFGLDAPEDRIAESVRRVGMTDRLDQRVGTLSHGMQKRFSIARALLHRPQVLLMDEPESGLDPSAIELMRGVVEATRDGGGAVLLVTHNFEEALALGDRLAILGRGRVAHVQDLGTASDGGSSTDGIRDLYYAHTGERPPSVRLGRREGEQPGRREG
jgi:heme exporter protein A